MALRLHHINVCGDDMGALTKFYTEGLGLTQLAPPSMTGDEGVAPESQTWGDTAAFFQAGHPDELQFHITKRRPYASFEYNQPINPLANGHLCFRTDDIEEIIERLNAHNVPFADYGYWAIENWRQIFLADPAGNIIEIHQVDEMTELQEFTPVGHLRLHHVNVCGDDIDALNRFYNQVLGLERLPSPGMTGDDGKNKTWGDSAQFFDAGDEHLLQLHATTRRAYAGYDSGQSVNGLMHGHIAFRTDDMNAVIERLMANGIPYSDYEKWAIKTWHQIFLPDPAGNVVEIHQVDA
ncbi:VOC family protein [Enteractinococcus helveticum]|uniref:VOC family protein n=1 Tax=Enteractinococcus helveticum TaxID=1837282 RepID=UPI00082BDD58|nr:VOC family protein [Enteractinococcus helveticum]